MKKLLLPLLFFAAGFMTHAFFFPEVLSNGITDVRNVILPTPFSQNTNQESSADTQLTTITFDGERFSRHNITIGFTRYVQIVNESQEKLMWLVSDVPELNTNRGFANSEAVKTQFNKKGQFVVADKNNPNEKLVITVK